MSLDHGGDVEAAARELGIRPEEILDFSANLNPAGLPPRAAARLAREAADLGLLARYPDPSARELRTVLAAQLYIPVESIVVGAGADALIHAALRAFAPRRCVIPVPAFSEYARACAAVSAVVVRIPLRAEDGFQLQREAWSEIAPGDTIIFNNPHNPTGACATRDEMLDRIAAARSRGATVLVDEAFIDYVPEAAITPTAAARDGVIAIRSLTKFFGCAGLRVGYAVASRETARAIQRQLPAWPVTGLAANALAEAVTDREYARATLDQNARARERLAQNLGALGCHVLPGAANFLLIELPPGVVAGDVRERLFRSGILVRSCDTFEPLTPGRYLRIAVRREDENARLAAALAPIFQHEYVSRNASPSNS
jgi:threonine-phosphate decarboxylase